MQMTRISCCICREVGIGFFPDVGGSYFLPRLPGNVGQYLGLSGARLKGRELYTAGIATHFVPNAKMGDLEQALVQLSNDGASAGAIDKAIADCGEGAAISLMTHCVCAFD